MRIFELFEASIDSTWITDLTYAYPWNLKTVLMTTAAGYKYRILDVPQHVLTKWKKSPSKGQFFHKYIKGQYRVVR